MKNESYLKNTATFYTLFVLIACLLMAAFCVTNSFAQTTVVFTTSGTFTVPSCVTSILVNVWGGGGGSGGGYGGCSFAGNGGGGGGGGFAQSTLAVSAGQVYTVSVGAGGSGGASGINAGTAGGTSTFTGTGGTVSAGGGGGGSDPSCTANSPGGSGGAGISGTLLHTGGSGSYGVCGCTSSGTPTGSGGGGAGSGSNGVSPTNGACAGSGAAGGNGTYPGGAGGYNPDCGVANAILAGVAGSAPGGGGSGPSAWGNAGGGSGARGQVTLVYTAGLPAASFTCSDTAFCTETGKCINFFDHSACSPTSWHWSFPGGSPASSTAQNPDSICYYTPGTYAVTLIVTNSAGSDTLAVSPLIIFGSTPPVPTITAHGDTLVSSSGSSYQWYFNGSPITGATNSFYICSQHGTYAVQITDSLGCSAISGGVGCVNDINELMEQSGIEIYPNPLTSSSVIQFNTQVNNAEVVIYDVLGKEMMRRKMDGDRMEIERGGLESGVYFVRVSSEEKQWVEKLVVE